MKSVCFLVVILVTLDSTFGLTLEEKIKDDPDLSEFYSYFESSQEGKLYLQMKQLTLFAPTNRAFQNHAIATDKSDLINYHLSNQAITLSQLGSKVSTELTGNPPLWVTRRPLAHGQGEDIYVNNAKVVLSKSNFQYTNPNKRKQVLHIIEDVLEPLRSVTGDHYNPDAYELLSNSNSYELQPHSLQKFRKCVEDYNKGSAFKSDSRYTFFIPVDAGFEDPTNRAGAIDEKIIDGHIIPHHVLFTTPTPFDVQYETLAFGDMVKVTIAFKREIEGKESNAIYIVSNTVVGDSKHPTGVVLAEIVKANIPVKNGVVHLISRPLMVVDRTIKAFLEESRGLLNLFYERILDSAPEFLSQIASASENVTLFAPSNAAMKSPSMTAVLANKTRLREVLSLHLVKKIKVTSEDVLRKGGLMEIPSQLPRKKLYLNVMQGQNNLTLTVEGGGVNATVIQPDIASTNGIIHIIDTVLGVPFTTVGRKVATDPQLRSAHKLGEMLHFNDQLDNTKNKYTYFVPRDAAWDKIKIQSPSMYKKVFMEDFAPNVKQILERHLVVSDRAYTMADLKAMANVSFTLPSVRDKLEIVVTESEADKTFEKYELPEDTPWYDLKGYFYGKRADIKPGTGFYISWRNQNIHVYRPDVECINGIIHVIDSIFLTESDIQVNAGRTITAPSVGSILSGAAALLVLMRLR
uniref:Fasciclin-1 n=1 Tax=Cacopsylla melanoneura TaxID=428564 RepID=A0A8D8RD41_9HEMI